MISVKEKQYIADTYSMIITEYFSKFMESSICNYEANGSHSYDIFQNQHNSNLLTGIIIINRTFEYIFIKTKNIQSSYYYANESITYYLEYMEQIYRSNLSQDINHSDALYFVYNKIIFEHFDSHSKGELVELGGKSILSNIIQSNNDDPLFTHISTEDFATAFSVIAKIVDVLLVWKQLTTENTYGVHSSLVEKPSYHVRIEFCQKYLETFLKDIEKNESIIERLILIYESLDISFTQWHELLNELAKCPETFDHRRRIPSKNKKSKNEDFVFSYYSNKQLILEKLEENDVVFVAKWLLQS